MCIRDRYNTARLDEHHLCYQRYLWQEDLNVSKEPEEKMIKTLIYGVKSSGNQAGYALLKVAEMQQEKYPEVYIIIRDDTYVDDFPPVDRTIQKPTKYLMKWRLS